MKHEQSRYLFTEGLFQLSLTEEVSLSRVTPSSEALEVFSSSLQSTDSLISLVEIVEVILEAIMLPRLDSIGGEGLEFIFDLSQ